MTGPIEEMTASLLEIGLTPQWVHAQATIGHPEALTLYVVWRHYGLSGADRLLDQVLDVPQHMHGGLLRYIVFGIKPGDGMCSLLSCNLIDIYQKCDDFNLACLREWASLIYLSLPRGCWGSEEKITGWCAEKGLQGVMSKHAENITIESQESP